MRILRFSVPEEMDGKTVKAALKDGLLISSAELSRLKRKPGGILLNGIPVYVNAPVFRGDLLSADISDVPEPGRTNPVRIPLEILFEDEDILILNKPAGITVHADSRRPEEITLENAIVGYLGDGAVPHPVSRLDRGTSGIITYAKNAWMHARLKSFQHTDRFRRFYLGIVHGIPEQREGSIDAPIGYAEGSRYQHAVTLNGAEAKTRYVRISSDPMRELSLMGMLPLTGRTHQLRVHLAYLGHPLVGDWLYGTEERDIIARPALHSWQLQFFHPIKEKTIRIECPVPDDFSAAYPGALEDAAHFWTENAGRQTELSRF